jgi:hypothetical protein
MLSTAKSIKSQILPLLVAALAADVLVAAIVVGPKGADWFSAHSEHTGSAAILSVLVLLLVNVIPAPWRDRLGHLRWTNPLPGNRAFTKYGPQDDRIDMIALERAHGPLPTTAKEQNALWYKLYKEVDKEVSVCESQKRYLLFRDLATMSFILLVASPSLAITFTWQMVGWIALILMLQMVLCAVTSRNTGIRFVANVLVLHSAKDEHKSKEIKTAAKAG